MAEPTQKFVFTEVPEAPVPSLLRNFSAPVKLEVPLLCLCGLMANPSQFY